MVDIRTLTVQDVTDEVEPYYTRIYSMLAPKHHLGSLVYPGLIWPHYFGPEAISTPTGGTLGDWLMKMVASRSRILMFINQI